jgi:hypothetical protein
VRLISLKTTERDNWWSELRNEITKNATCLNCTHILGYKEVVSVYQDVMVLTAYGTGVKIKDNKIRKDFMPKQQMLARVRTTEYSPKFEIPPTLNKFSSVP